MMHHCKQLLDILSLLRSFFLSRVLNMWWISLNDSDWLLKEIQFFENVFLLIKHVAKPRLPSKIKKLEFEKNWLFTLSDYWTFIFLNRKMLFCVSCGKKVRNFAEKHITRVHMNSVQFETSLLLIRKLNCQETA